MYSVSREQGHMSYREYVGIEPESPTNNAYIIIEVSSSKDLFALRLAISCKFVSVKVLS